MRPVVELTIDEPGDIEMPFAEATDAEIDEQVEAMAEHYTDYEDASAATKMKPENYADLTIFFKQTTAYEICDNKDPEERICPAQVSGLKAQVRAENIKETEEFQTMLLTPKEKPDHILVSAKPENGDIPVGYVPFVIGKHTGLADHILDKPTVSRFHVRIMEKGGDYFLTDLNSTNGTKVNGKLLAANEEIMLKEGDEVQIAEEKYFWK